MIAEITVAFATLLAASLGTYLLSGMNKSRSNGTGKGDSMYFCGEQATPGRFSVSITFYEYLIYFVIIDASSLLIALAATGIGALNPLFPIGYLCLTLIAVFILSRGV